MLLNLCSQGKSPYKGFPIRNLKLQCQEIKSNCILCKQPQFLASILDFVFVLHNPSRKYGRCIHDNGRFWTNLHERFPRLWDHTLPLSDDQSDGRGWIIQHCRSYHYPGECRWQLSRMLKTPFTKIHSWKHYCRKQGKCACRRHLFYKKNMINWLLSARKRSLKFVYQIVFIQVMCYTFFSIGTIKNCEFVNNHNYQYYYNILYL